jgi:hypothetical protein
MTCKNCVFWFPPEAEGPGFCRRYPPQSFMIQTPPNGGLQIAGRMPKQEMAMTTNFPPTNADVWCGEHKAVE